MTGLVLIKLNKMKWYCKYESLVKTQLF